MWLRILKRIEKWYDDRCWEAGGNESGEINAKPFKFNCGYRPLYAIKAEREEKRELVMDLLLLRVYPFWLKLKLNWNWNWIGVSQKIIVMKYWFVSCGINIFTNRRIKLWWGRRGKGIVREWRRERIWGNGT